MATIPAGYEIGRPHRQELGELEAIELAAATIFPPEDLTPGDAGLPQSFFEQASSAGRLWVARTLEPAAPVGFAAATLMDGTAHLYELDVLPAHGRKGLGRALVLHVAHWAQESRFVSLTLTTFRHLPWNAPFYASIGFVAMAEREVGPSLRVAMAEEAAHGLDPAKRVAMKLDLQGQTFAGRFIPS